MAALLLAVISGLFEQITETVLSIPGLTSGFSSDVADAIASITGAILALYQVKYPVKGNVLLAKRVISLLSGQISVANSWGINHGTWTVLVHMFPKADIPVVQPSVDATLPRAKRCEIGHL